MAGTAQAAERIRCDRCSGHYVVDAASDGTPRVRCNKCGHLREVQEPVPASIPGKWTVIGPDGKAMSFDTWEELTDSRRPSAITPTAKGMEEANHALKDLKPTPEKEKKSASALLDITPAPKLALADMDSAIDLGEPLGGHRKSRPGATTMLQGSTSSTSPGSGSESGKLEPLLVRSFSQPPKSKVEWAPKIEKGKSDVAPRLSPEPPTPRGDFDNTMRVELAPSHQVVSAPAPTNVHMAPAAPATTKVIEADRPTAPTAVADSAESLDELDADSLLDDVEEDDEPAPVSLKDMIQESEEELNDDDLEEESPDPHELLSLRDLVAADPSKHEEPTKPMTMSAPPPPNPAKTTLLSQGPPKAVARSQAPPARKSVAPPAPLPRPRSLSRPDVPEGASRPPPSIRPDIQDAKAEQAATKRTTARASVAAAEPKANRTWMWVVLGLALAGGVFWRMSQKPEEAPKPTPTPTVATIVPPTPVTTPGTNTTTPPTPTDTVVSTVSTDTPPATTTSTAPTNATAPGPSPTPTPVTTGEKPTAEKPVAVKTPTENTGADPKPTPAEKKPTVANTDSPGSMSDLLDKAGSARRKGDFATARDLYGRVIAMSPSNVEANGGLGDVARAQGDLAGAKSSYERALAASPTYSPALLGLADVEWDQGNQASARKRYAQVVDRMGDRAPQRAKERSQQ